MRTFAAIARITGLLLGCCLLLTFDGTVTKIARAQDAEIRPHRINDATRRHQGRRATLLAPRIRTVHDLARLKALGLTDAEVSDEMFLHSSSQFPIWEAPIASTGEPPLLVVMVDFPDHPAATAFPGLTAARAQENIFGKIGSPDKHSQEQRYPFDSLRNFYERASQGKLRLTGEVHGWVRMDSARASYLPQPAGVKPTDDELQRAAFALIAEALSKIDSLVDFSKFDQNSDGSIDSVAILYSGPIGSHGDFFYAFQYAVDYQIAKSQLFDGLLVGNFVLQNVETKGRLDGTVDFYPETLAHEVGHLLGLEDYYDTCPIIDKANCAAPGRDPGPDGGVGGFDLMDGQWANHNAYSRWLMRWISPVVIGAGRHRIALRPASESTSPILTGDMVDAVAIVPSTVPLMTSGYPAQELFILEYRTAAGNDSLAGFEGIAIWHVAASPTDAPLDFSYNNSFGTPKQLRLLRANNNRDFRGPATIDGDPETAVEHDLFREGDAFGVATIPPSRLHSGGETGIEISDIKLYSDAAEVTIEVAPPPVRPLALLALGEHERPRPLLDLDPDQLIAKAQAWRMTPAEALAQRWAYLAKIAATRPLGPKHLVEARMVFVAWTAKAAPDAAAALAVGPELLRLAVADVVDDGLRAYSLAMPYHASEALFDGRLRSALDAVGPAGTADIVKHIFSGRRLDTADALARDIDRLEGPPLLLAAVQGLRKAAPAAATLDQVAALLKVQASGFAEAVDLDNSLRRVAATAGALAADTLADDLLKSIADGVPSTPKAIE